MANVRPFNRNVRRVTSSAPPNVRIQNRWLIIATGDQLAIEWSSGCSVRPRAAGTPSARK
jgi:hypothetical protein